MLSEIAAAESKTLHKYIEVCKGTFYRHCRCREVVQTFRFILSLNSLTKGPATMCRSALFMIARDGGGVHVALCTILRSHGIATFKNHFSLHSSD
jgi:hypothetical protein